MNPKIKITNVEFRREFMGDLVVDDYTVIIDDVVEMNQMEVYETFFNSHYDNLSTQCDLLAHARALELERDEEDLREEVREYRHGRMHYGRAGYGHLESSLHP